MEKNVETTGILGLIWSLGFRVGMKEWERTWKLL